MYDEPLNISSMEEDKATYKDIKLEPAEDGYILSWTKYTPAMKNSESIYDHKKKVFKMNEEDAAISEMSNLHKENLKMYKEYMEKEKGEKEKGENSSHGKMY